MTPARENENAARRKNINEWARDEEIINDWAESLREQLNALDCSIDIQTGTFKEYDEIEIICHVLRKTKDRVD